MTEPKRHYDPATKTLRVHWEHLTGMALLDRDTLQPYINLLIGEARAAEGEVKHVHFVFDDAETADYNHDSLKFVRIKTYVSTEGGELAPVDPEDGPTFAVRDDFGL